MSAVIKMVKEVLVLFKTHLDIGYTDYAENVVDRYVNKFIPGAIELGYALKLTSIIISGIQISPCGTGMTLCSDSRL